MKDDTKGGKDLRERKKGHQALFSLITVFKVIQMPFYESKISIFLR